MESAAHFASSACPPMRHFAGKVCGDWTVVLGAFALLGLKPIKEERHKFMGVLLLIIAKVLCRLGQRLLHWGDVNALLSLGGEQEQYLDRGDIWPEIAGINGFGRDPLTPWERSFRRSATVRRALKGVGVESLWN